MLESIRILTDIPTDTGQHFTREDLAAARERRRLLDEARRRASQCIAEANVEAENIRTYAFLEGYGHGVLQASADMADLLVRARTLNAQLYNELARAAEQLLGGLLKQDRWFDQALTSWLAEQGGDDRGVLYVLLPERCKGQSKTLAQRLSERWAGALSIEYHDQERYLLRLADQVLEFDIDSIRSNLTPHLLAQVKALPDAVRQLDEGVIQTLQQMLGSYIEQCVSSSSQPESGGSGDVDQPSLFA